MSYLQAASSAVPVSADEISRRSYEQKYLIEEKIIMSLVEIINQGIRDQVSHGLLQYEFGVPSFIYGFPKFDVQYVASQLRKLYAMKGFEVTGQGQTATLTWKHGNTMTSPKPLATTRHLSLMPAPAPPAPAPPASRKKKHLRLLSS